MAITTSPTSTQSTSTPPVIDQIKALAEELRMRGAKDGARRLDILSKQYRQFTVEGASQYIRKDDILDELDSQPQIWLTGLRFLRNVFSILPIVFTWLALGLAAIAYQSDLGDSRYSAQDKYQSFLYLWQGSFHGNHGGVIPFSAAAYTDVILLAVLVLLVATIPMLEYWHRFNLRRSLEDFDATIDNLLALIAIDGSNSRLAPSDVNIITQAIEAALDKVTSRYNSVVVEVGELVQDTHEKTTDILAYTQEKTKAIFDDFHKDLLVYNTDIKLLNNGLKKMDTNLGNYGQKLSELTDASNKLAGSSNDLALNAKSMAESATLSSQASQGISTQLGALNTTQQEIVKTQKDVVQEFASAQKDVIQELTTTQRQVVQDVTTSQQSVVQQIENSQKEVVKQLTNASDKVADSGKFMRDATHELDRVAGDLEQLTRTDFQNMTNGILQANQTLDVDVRKISSDVQQVTNSLNGVNAQLAQTSQQLQATMQAFTQAMNDATQKFPQAVHDSSQQFKKTVDDASQKLAKASGAQPKRRFWFF